jgi:hypothetical protein
MNLIRQKKNKVVFISHSSKDLLFIEKELIPMLKEFHIPFWYCKDEIHGSQQWERSIRDALKETEYLIIIISKYSIDSEWVHAEVHWSLENKPGRVIPILLDNSDPSHLHIKLSSIQYIDFRNDKADAKKKLHAAFDFVAIEIKSEIKDNSVATDEKVITTSAADKNTIIEIQKRDLKSTTWSGPVFTANHLIWNKKIIIREINNQKIDDPVYENLVDSLKRLIVLRFPRIIRIFDIIINENRSIDIIQDFIEEVTSLEEYRLNNVVPISLTIKWVLSLAECINFAHSKGIVHGWISPSLILVDNKNEIHLCGFEEVYLINAFNPPHGTLCYRDPLTYGTEIPTPQWDIWSIGAILYELVYNDQFIFSSNWNEQSKLVSLKNSRSKYDQIWYRCVSNNLEERFSTVRELIHEIKKIDI